MPWTMRHAEAEQVLVLGYYGIITAEELQEANFRAVSAVMEQKIGKVMVDCSAARAEMPILDVYKLPDMYMAEGAPRTVQVAMILPRDGYKREVYEFYEDVCRNRGFHVQVFEDGDDAWAWLQSGMPTPATLS